MSQDFFVTGRISDNIGETEDGFVVCLGSILGRSGTQKYSVGELPQEAADALGVDLSDPSAMVDVYRAPEEVFNEQSLSSANGKPLTAGHPPNGAFVNPSNVAELSVGHIQNVRQGDEPLESGDLPLLGDIVITREPLISQIKNGDRPDLSLGYSYSLDLDGKRLAQKDIRINHCATVGRGRAGEARVVDSAPAIPAPAAPPTESAPPTVSDPKPEPEPARAADQKAGGEAALPAKVQPKKEHRKMDFKHIFGRGLLTLARDEKTTPEEMAEAAEAMPVEDHGKDETPPAEPKPKVEPEPEPEPVAEDRRKKAKDAMKTKDAAGADHRAKMHAALDRLLAEQGGDPDKEGVAPVPDVKEEPREVVAEDVDLDELRDLLSEFFEEEETEPAHQDGEVMEPEGEEGVADHRRAVAADGNFIEPGGRQGASDDVQAVLAALRPHVARSGDAAVRRAFNGQLARYSRSGAPSKGSYARFAGAARTRAADAGAEPTLDQQQKYQQEYQKACDDIRLGRKPTLTEVK